MPRELTQLLAYVMPLHPKQIDWFTSRKSGVIGKFFPRTQTISRFKKGTIIIFYRSKGGNNVVLGLQASPLLKVQEWELCLYNDYSAKPSDSLNSFHTYTVS